MGDKNYMTPKEAAELWNVTPGTVCRWCREGKIVAVPKKNKSDGRWRIPYGAERPNKRK